MRGNAARAAFGDFQTPAPLAEAAVALVRRLGVRPGAVVEPTCGRGAFVLAAARAFPDAPILGVDVNAGHLAALKAGLDGAAGRVALFQADAFAFDWAAALAGLPDPLLVLGNPPWVTNAALGVMGSANRPARGNSEGLRGLDAVTGRSNFDVSEFLIRRHLDWLAERRGALGGALAVLCKTAVARKALAYAWMRGSPVARARLFRIDAQAAFGASVDAGLLFVEMGEAGGEAECPVFDGLSEDRPAGALGFIDGLLVADAAAYRAHRFEAAPPGAPWRSGIKHDCARVMELVHDGQGWVNGLGERVDAEDSVLFPLLKSADLTGTRPPPRRALIVTQRETGEPTARLEREAPRAWAYLRRHADALAARASAIYRGRPEFSLFGVGAYAFADWKIAISGFAKTPAFHLIGPADGRPVVFDDTVYTLPRADEAEARRTFAALTGDRAQALLRSLIFPTDKRPITAAVLNRVGDGGGAGQKAALPMSVTRQAPAGPDVRTDGDAPSTGRC